MGITTGTSAGTPELVRGLDKGPLRMRDLPKPGTTRWNGQRKVVLIGALRGGLITKDEAQRRYDLTEAELDAWEARFEADGIGGLYFPRIPKKMRGEPGHTERRTRGWTVQLSVEPIRTCGDLMVEPAKRLISYRGAQESILEMQMMILVELMKRPEDVVSKHVLHNALWAERGAAPFHRILDVGMCHLRKRLFAISKRSWIKTEWGRGYRWMAEV
jgi:hypothetical protein